jgi:hypothetical protein
MKSNLSVAVALALSLVVVGGPWSMAQGGPVTGAIFTTLANGSTVNSNHFDSKCAVYLDGGPGPNAPAGAAGLPDGDYYFQVTDPSGRQLLSTDVVSNRRFQVTSGVIVAYTGSGGPIHPTGIDLDHPELGAVTIRLADASCPSDFLDSPNNGGAYKVWATPVGDFVGDPAKVDNDCGNGCFHGFLPAKSKTDNFKARAGTATFCLTVNKQIQQAGGPFIPASNWGITVTDSLGVSNTYFTDVAGQAMVCGLTEGAYTVTEVVEPGYELVGLIVNGVPVPVELVYSFTWTAGKLAPVIVFLNNYPISG